jgi:hypothetical protein
VRLTTHLHLVQRLRISGFSVGAHPHFFIARVGGGADPEAIQNLSLILRIIKIMSISITVTIHCLQLRLYTYKYNYMLHDSMTVSYFLAFFYFINLLFKIIIY